MPLRIWPKDYERKRHITREEKLLLRNALLNFKEGHFAIGIDPVGMSTDKVHMGFYISPRKGLLSFSIYTELIDPNLIDAYKQYVQMVEDKIHKRLLDSKALIVRNGENKFLKFPYRHVILFVNEKQRAVWKKDTTLQTLAPYVYVRFFNPIKKRKMGADLMLAINVARDCRVAYDQAFKEMTEQECRAVFERLAPEYTVVMRERDLVEFRQTDTVSVEHRQTDTASAEHRQTDTASAEFRQAGTASAEFRQVGTTPAEFRQAGTTPAAQVPADRDFKITGRELEYKTFFLDEYQVAQVNDMGKGHRVLLANPGAGKSVLLLSKAFKYASLYKESKVLLTCYNNNLANAYLFKKSCANFGDNRNLYIMTFHKMVKKIFEECLHKRCYSNIATPGEIQECLDRVRSGEVKIRFKAIFIDEVQIFEPVYLELCYALLEKGSDVTFLMAGDLNQSVRLQSRRGDAPWKKINGVTLDFTGRVKYIERNYRNSRQIGLFLNRMLRYMNKYMEQYGMISTKEFQYNSFEQGGHEGIALKIRAGIDRIQIQAHVLAAIKEMVNKYQVGYSDIAVLFPMKKNAALNYYFLYWLTGVLDREGIPYSLIAPSDRAGQAKVRYSEAAGVVLSTIDSSLGLDFKAVIVAGLYPYGYYFTDNGIKVPITSWQKIGSSGKSVQEKVQVQMRKLYTACSRARDILYVLSDMHPGSPMEQLLTEALRENA